MKRVTGEEVKKAADCLGFKAMNRKPGWWLYSKGKVISFIGRSNTDALENLKRYL